MLTLHCHPSLTLDDIMNINVCLCECMSVCAPVCLSVRLCVCVSVFCLCVMSVYLSVCSEAREGPTGLGSC